MGETLAVDPVEDGEVACIVEPDGCLYNIGKRTAGESERRLDVGDHLLGLLGNGALDQKPVGADRGLTGYEDEVAGANGGRKGNAGLAETLLCHAVLSFRFRFPSEMHDAFG